MKDTYAKKMKEHVSMVTQHAKKLTQHVGKLHKYLKEGSKMEEMKESPKKEKKEQDAEGKMVGPWGRK